MKKTGFALFVLILAVFLALVRGVDGEYRRQGRLQLEQALRRTAVACYAAQGFYPPSVAYMQEHYGLQYQQELYVIHYEVFASNLMPEIVVLEVSP